MWCGRDFWKWVVKQICDLVDVFLLPSTGGVIAYISSSSSASSPASCHSEGSESSFLSSSPVPQSPNSSSSDGSSSSKSKEGSDGVPKNDQLDDRVKASQPSVTALAKGHGGLTSKYSFVVALLLFRLNSGIMFPVYGWENGRECAQGSIFSHVLCYWAWSGFDYKSGYFKPWFGDSPSQHYPYLVPIRA